MFYLIWINERCQPGRMYGPAEYEVCQKKMVEFVKEDAITFNLEDEFCINPETGEGWYIIQAEEF